jgi:hypothetical protein
VNTILQMLVKHVLESKLLDKMLSESKGKGRARNLARGANLGFGALILFVVSTLPAKIDKLTDSAAAMNVRLAKVEGHLGIATASTNAVSGVGISSVAPQANDGRPFTFARKGDLK